jgi:hypothetical protein
MDCIIRADIEAAGAAKTIGGHFAFFYQSLCSINGTGANAGAAFSAIIMIYLYPRYAETLRNP